MKKWILLVVFCLVLSGCSLLPDTSDDNGENSTPTTTTDASPFITEEQAIAVAAQYFGIEPGTVDNDTGFVMSYRSLYPLDEENPYYVIALQWLVTIDGEPSHQSMLDSVVVDAVTGEVSPSDSET